MQGHDIFDDRMGGKDPVTLTIERTNTLINDSSIENIEMTIGG